MLPSRYKSAFFLFNHKLKGNLYFVMQTTFKDLNLLLSQEFSSRDFLFCVYFFLFP